MNARFRACCIALALAAGACSSSSNAPPVPLVEVACTDVDASSAACAVDGGAGITYATVQPIVARSCVPCHDNPDPDPDAGDTWPLLTYEDVSSWTTVVKEDILNCTMPPADGGVPISAKDRDQLVQWILCGAPP